MYKKLLLIAFTLLSCNILFSQDQWDWNDAPASHDRSYSIAIGPKAGIGIAMGTDGVFMANSMEYKFDFKNGVAYQIGAKANIHFGRRYPQSPGGTGWFGIEAEILYGNRNIKAKENGNLRMHCLEIPILVEIYPIPSLAIEIGPTFVSILKCSPEQLYFDDVEPNTIAVGAPQIGQISGSDLMLTFGINYKLPMGLAFDARYNLGNMGLAGNFDCKISSLMVTVSYLFSLVN